MPTDEQPHASVTVPSAARVYDTTGIQELLPHRYPFLLVDRIDVIEPGKHVVGTKRLTGGEWWASRGDAELPFSLLIEALAQTGGALIPDLATGIPGAIAYFMGADRVRIRRPAHAGDVVRFDVMLRQWRRGICRTEARATIDGALVMSAALTTIVRPAVTTP